MRQTGRMLSVLLLVALATCRAAPSPAPEARAHRIVSLVPAATEMLYAMGAGAAIVGVSSFDRFPPDVNELPRVGALVDPDFERVLTLRPSLVIVYGTQHDLMARLKRASIEFFPYRHAANSGLTDITRTMRTLGDRIGFKDTAGAEATRIEQELAEVRAHVGDLPRPSTALVFGRERGTLRGIYASGGAGFLHDLLVLAGGRNVFEDVPRENLQVSVETLLARAPDVIVELRSSSEGIGTLDTELAAWSRLAGLPAVRHNRVHILIDDSLSIPGPRIATAARTLRSVLHPDP